jgi:hypothetical protein
MLLEKSNPYFDAKAISLPEVLVTRRIELEEIRVIRMELPDSVENRVTSFCQPLLSFLSKPARIDATPVLYEKSRE